MARAQLIEPLEADQETDEEILEEQPLEEEQSAEEDSEVPEKYRGKSIQEIVQMHQEAEKLIGRRGSEVGELRSIIDNFIKDKSKQEPEKQDDPVDFFSEPEKATAKAIENHPKVKQAEEFAETYRRENALTKLTQKHPDMQDIVQDSGFQDWIAASKVRTKLFQEADQNYDYDSADELFSLWKERKQVVEQTKEVEKETRKQAVRSASTGNARGTGEVARKVYRRADIIKLMRDDPERYSALSDEILRAYREGRVK